MVRPGDTKLRQFEGYNTFEDRGRNEYIEAKPFVTGETLILAPEIPSGASPFRPCPANCSCSTAATWPRTAGSSPGRCSDPDDRQGGRVGGSSEHHAQLDADARHRLLAGGLPPVAEEGRGNQTRQERLGARDGVGLRSHGRRHAVERRKALSSRGASTCVTGK